VARLLLRLRLRLLRNTLKLGSQQAISFVLGAISGTIMSLVIASIYMASATEPVWGDTVVLGFAALWLGWLVLPAVGFSSDDTLDPRRFALFPLSPRELLPGLLLGALAGIGPIASLIAVGGAVAGAGLAGGSPGVVTLAALAAVGAVIASVAWSRALLAMASDLLNSRRGKDLTALASLVTLGAIVVGPQLLGRGGPSLGAGSLSTAAGIASWTPGGLAGAALRAAVDGDLAGSALRLAGLAGTIAAALALWGLAMRRQQRVSPVQASGGGHGTSLYPRTLRWLPRNRLTAVAVRYLRTLVRDVRVRSQALSTTFVIIPLFVISAGAIPGPTAPLYATYLVIPFGMLAANQLGHDGPALWFHELAGQDTRSDLLGRDLALATLALPLAVLGVVGLAAAFDAWETVPAAILLSLAVLLALLGVSNAAATIAPYPIPEDPSNIFGGGGSGMGFLQGITALAVLLVHAVLILPVLLPTLLLDAAGSRLLAAGLGVGYGVALLAGGTALGVARARGRGPELLMAIDPRRS
jgi:ABC-2 type transport system permease protein